MLFGVGGVVGFALLACWVWALVDCITSDGQSVRNLPKLLWLVVVVLLLDIGALLWLLLGRPLRSSGPRLDRDSRDALPRHPRVEDRIGAVEPVITDRRSAELDRRLEAWERERDRQREVRERSHEDE